MSKVQEILNLVVSNREEFDFNSYVIFMIKYILFIVQLQRFVNSSEA